MFNNCEGHSSVHRSFRVIEERVSGAEEMKAGRLLRTVYGTFASVSPFVTVVAVSGRTTVSDESAVHDATLSALTVGVPRAIL